MNAMEHVSLHRLIKGAMVPLKEKGTGRGSLVPWIEYSRQLGARYGSYQVHRVVIFTSREVFLSNVPFWMCCFYGLSPRGMELGQDEAGSGFEEGLCLGFAAFL